MHGLGGLLDEEGEVPHEQQKWWEVLRKEEVLHGEEVLHAEGELLHEVGGLLDEEGEVPHKEGAPLDEEGESHQ